MSCGTPCDKPFTIPWAAHGALGLAKAALRIQRAPEAVIKDRLDNHCRTCEHSRKNPKRKTSDGLPLVSYCNLCKCNLRAKTANAGEACCDGRWPAVEKIGKTG